MPSYSSDEFRRDWVYDIDKDFHSYDGTTPATWAAGQPTEWGHEHSKIPLPTEPGAACLNADASLLAIALEHDIYLYSISDLSLYQVLKGHVSRVDALRFHPKDARTLISCAMNDRAGPEKGEPEIVFWNLDEERQSKLLSPDTIHTLGKRAVDSVVQGLACNPSPSWQMDSDDQSVLTKDVERVITTLNVKSQLRMKTRISGRLVDGAHIFDSTGSSMAFLPESRPPSNGDARWDICIYDTPTNKIRLTLSGHRDAIMWVGFSPNDKLIASVSWDQTFRIWEHRTGNLLHTFRSEGQNWTGAFSPDSRFFAGTSGQGRLWVWDVVHGLEATTYDLLSLGQWHRHLDWSPDGKRLVIGSDELGRVVMFDVKSQSVVQERVLSMRKSPEALQRMGSRYLEVSEVRYVDGGRKIAFRCACDDGLEVYDFLKNRKWRFAPAQGLDRSWSSGDFVVLEEKEMIASIDADAVRFWKVPFGEGE